MLALKKLSYLPFTELYYIDKETNIIYSVTNERKTKLVEIIFNNGKPQIMLNWICGLKYYDLSYVILIGNMDIPYPVWVCRRIKTVYKNNNDIYIFKNIIMYFENPVEDLLYSGFYYVPYYPTILLNKEGDVLNIRTHKFQSVIKTKPSQALQEVKHITGGYLTARASDLRGFNNVVKIHRLLCLTFHKYNGTWEFDWNKQVVNHIDGNPTNNNLDNLEWTTYSLNNKHAIDNGLRISQRSVLRLNTVTNKIEKFNSINDLIKETGESHSKICRRILKPYRKYPDGFSYKFDDGKPWPELESFVTTKGSRDI